MYVTKHAEVIFLRINMENPHPQKKKEEEVILIYTDAINKEVFNQTYSYH